MNPGERKEGRNLPVPEDHFGKADAQDSSSWEIQADSQRLAWVPGWTGVIHGKGAAEGRAGLGEVTLGLGLRGRAPWQVVWGAPSCPG